MLLFFVKFPLFLRGFDGAKLQLINQLSINKEKEICFKLIKLITDKYSDEEWNNLYSQISKTFKEENPPEEDSISNLTLLDAGTNRAYKNAFFPIKLMEIMKREMQGSFVPIVTKNVFMKAYSRKFDKVMYWDQADANDYLIALENCLNIYKK